MLAALVPERIAVFVWLVCPFRYSSRKDRVGKDKHRIR